MNFINQLSKHKIVEVNRLTGLLSGHMVAQAPYRTVKTTFDNGAIMFLDDAAELVLGNDAGAQKKQPFLHYTEELLTGPVSGLEYFTVDVVGANGTSVEGVCYPRAIALYEGDQFTTNNIAGTIPAANVKKFAIVSAVADETLNKLFIVDAIPTTTYQGPLFVVEKDTLPAGQPAVRLTLVNKHLVV